MAVIVLVNLNFTSCFFMLPDPESQVDVKIYDISNIAINQHTRNIKLHAIITKVPQLCVVDLNTTFLSLISGHDISRKRVVGYRPLIHYVTCNNLDLFHLGHYLPLTQLHVMVSGHVCDDGLESCTVLIELIETRANHQFIFALPYKFMGLGNGGSLGRM